MNGEQDSGEITISAMRDQWPMRGLMFVLPSSFADVIAQQFRVAHEAERLVNDIDAIHGHGRLMLEEAAALASTSPYSLSDSIALIYIRETGLHHARTYERQFAELDDALRALGKAIRAAIPNMAEAIAEAMPESIADAYADGFIDPEPDAIDWQDSRRDAIAGMTGYPIRAASDPAFHRARAWRDRCGTMRTYLTVNAPRHPRGTSRRR